MKLRYLWPSALCLSACLVQAQDTNEVGQLKQQLQQLQENFERAQREQRQQIEALTKKLDELTKQQTAEAEKKKLEQELAAQLSSNQPPASAQAPTSAAPLATGAWSPEQPLTIARAGSAYMNLKFDALMAVGWSTASDPSHILNPGVHEPINRGLLLCNAQSVMDGASDRDFAWLTNI